MNNFFNIDADNYNFCHFVEKFNMNVEHWLLSMYVNHSLFLQQSMMKKSITSSMDYFFNFNVDNHICSYDKNVINFSYHQYYKINIYFEELNHFFYIKFVNQFSPHKLEKSSNRSLNTNKSKQEENWYKSYYPLKINNKRSQQTEISPPAFGTCPWQFYCFLV